MLAKITNEDGGVVNIYLNPDKVLEYSEKGYEIFEDDGVTKLDPKEASNRSQTVSFKLF